MGLEINLDSFKKMSAKERDVLIYQNVLETKKKLSNYQTNKKIQYSWLAALTTGIFFILKLFVKSK